MAQRQSGNEPRNASDFSGNRLSLTERPIRGRLPGLSSSQKSQSSLDQVSTSSDTNSKGGFLASEESKSRLLQSLSKSVMQVCQSKRSTVNKIGVAGRLLCLVLRLISIDTSLSALYPDHHHHGFSFLATRSTKTQATHIPFSYLTFLYIYTGLLYYGPSHFLVAITTSRRHELLRLPTCISECIASQAWYSRSSLPGCLPRCSQHSFRISSQRKCLR